MCLYCRTFAAELQPGRFKIASASAWGGYQGMFSFDTKREEKCGGACKAWKGLLQNKRPRFQTIQRNNLGCIFLKLKQVQHFFSKIKNFWWRCDALAFCIVRFYDCFLLCLGRLCCIILQQPLSSRRPVCAANAVRLAQQGHSDFDALEPRKRGCSPLLPPKGRAPPEKTEDSRLFGVKIF